MAFRRRRPSLAVWQLRLRDRRRRAQLTAGVLLLLVVAAYEVRLHRVRAEPATQSPAADPVAEIADAAGAEVGPGGRSGDGLGPDERAVAIAPPLAVPPLAPGDRVEVVAVGLDAAGQPRATAIGDPVRITAVDDTAIVLAVPSSMVGPILAAQAAGPIETVRLP